jgi:hypothetical protein
MTKQRARNLAAFLLFASCITAVAKKKEHGELRPGASKRRCCTWRPVHFFEKPTCAEGLAL